MFYIEVFMPKPTKKTAPKRKSLSKLIEESLTLAESTDVKEQLLAGLKNLSQAKKEALRELLENEIQRKDEIETEEMTKKKKLLDTTQVKFTQLKKDHQRQERERLELEARHGEEAFAKKLLEKLEDTE
jgi:hypothetical protein